MKLKLLLAALLLVGTAFAQNAGAPKDKNSPPKQKQGKLVFKKLSHDFGEIEKGAPVTVNFEFTNTSNEVIEIKDVKPSCGCTSATPDKTSYNPGETGRIPVTFNPERFQNSFLKKVTVKTSDTEVPVTDLSIRGIIVVDVNLKPSHLFMPKVKRTSTTTKEFTVDTTRMDKLDITGLSVEPAEFLTASVKQIDAKKVSIVVSVDGSKIPKNRKRITGKVSFATNSPSKQKAMSANLTINVEDPVSVKPRPSVYFYGSKVGQKREYTLQLTSNVAAKLELKDVKSSLEYVSVEMLPVDEKTTTLKVTLNDNAPKGRFTGDITVGTNIPEQDKIVIPVRGAVN